MRYFKKFFGTMHARVSIQMSSNFVRHLRQYLHLRDDEPLRLYGGIVAISSGFGWYTAYAYNPRENGADLEFAVKQLELAARWMDRKITSEIKWLLAQSTTAQRLDVDDQNELVGQLQRANVVRDAKMQWANRTGAYNTQSKNSTRPASRSALELLARRVNSRYHHAGDHHASR